MPICYNCNTEVEWNNDFFVAESEGRDITEITKFLNLDGTPHICNNKNKVSKSLQQQRDLYWARNNIERAINGFLSSRTEYLKKLLSKEGIPLDFIIKNSCINNRDKTYTDKDGFTLSVKNLVIQDLNRRIYCFDHKFTVDTDEIVYIVKRNADDKRPQKKEIMI